MGAHPYFYFVPYQPDVEAALRELRQREFAAGRYNPVQPFLDFPLQPDSPAPGAEHETIEDAIEDAAEDGTRSILDIMEISEFPEFSAAAPLSREELQDYFATDKPTHAQVSDQLDFMAAIERGHCIYFTVYSAGQPSELFFAGYSFD